MPVLDAPVPPPAYTLGEHVLAPYPFRGMMKFMVIPPRPIDLTPHIDRPNEIIETEGAAYRVKDGDGEWRYTLHRLNALDKPETGGNAHYAWWVPESRIKTTEPETE